MLSVGDVKRDGYSRSREITKRWLDPVKRIALTGTITNQIIIISLNIFIYFYWKFLLNEQECVLHLMNGEGMECVVPVKWLRGSDTR